MDTQLAVEPRTNVWRHGFFEVLLVVGGYFAYGLSKNLIDPTPIMVAYQNSRLVLRLEQFLHINFEPEAQVLFSKYAYGLVEFLTVFYAVGLWLGIGLTAITLFAFRPALYREMRMVFFITLGLGLLIFTAFPLAPPRLLPGYGLTDTVTLLGFSPPDSAESPDSIFSYNKYAAMPSLHYTWALLIAIAWMRSGVHWLRPFAHAYHLSMAIAVVVTANHYVLDVIAGALMLAFAFWLYGWIRNYRLTHARPTAPLGGGASP